MDQRGSFKGSNINENKKITYKNIWEAAKTVMKEVYSIKCLQFAELRKSLKSIATFLGKKPGKINPKQVERRK